LIALFSRKPGNMKFTAFSFRIAAIVALALAGHQGLGIAANPGDKFNRDVLITRPQQAPARYQTPVAPLRPTAGSGFALAPRFVAAPAGLAAETAAPPAPADSAARKSKKKKSPTGAMVRSILIPGWGQFYNGKYFKAAAVFAIETGIVASAIYLNRLAEDSKTDENRAYYLDQRNLRYWWLLLAKLLSMLDAYVDAHLADFDESPSLSVTPSMDLPARGGYAVRLGLRF